MPRTTRVWCISDTHCLHDQLQVPASLDAVIVAGDMSNIQYKPQNFVEVYDFAMWLARLPIKQKIVVAGNHDTCLETKVGREIFTGIEGLEYLEHSATFLNNTGMIVFGSPYTPTFGTGWAFNKDRGKLGKYWEDIPLNTEILVTHGPPKGILDLSKNHKNEYEQCGDSSLTKVVMGRLPVLRYHIFGHIHDSEGCFNQGTRKLNNVRTTFVNASCVRDGEFNKGPSSHGVVLEL